MELTQFLSENGLTPDRESFHQWRLAFGEEMLRGLAGEESSLPMIPTYLSPEDLPREGEPVMVLDAGGTNLRAALMEKGPQGWQATELHKRPMLGTQGRLTLTEFYDALAQELAPFAQRTQRLGFCFSFPCEILPDLDGKILHFDKEVDIEGAPGSILGEGLRAAFARRGLPEGLRVAVINDTVAAMLGAQAQGESGHTYMGLILGTGVNLCAAFPNQYIKKVPALAARPGSTIVNLESGNFNRFPRSPIDLAFDATTANPGGQPMEKVLSGAYQGPMVEAYLRAAGGAGLLSASTLRRLDGLGGLTAKDVSLFLTDPIGENRLAGAIQQSGDRAAALAILDGFFRRAALLTAASLAAVLEVSGQAADPQRPVLISAEGTTFYHSPLLRRYLFEAMDDLVAGELDLYSRFVQADNPNLAGTALAAQGV